MVCPYIFFIGPPNSGKTYLANRLTARYLINHTRSSPGNLLRQYAANKTPLGEYIVNNWNHKHLSPIVNEILSIEFAKSSRMVVDGYPRDMREVMHMPTLCASRPFIIIELICDEPLLRKRSEERQRNGDDSVEAFNIRIASYYDNITAIREQLREWGVYYMMVNGGMGSVEQQIESIYSVVRTYDTIVSSLIYKNPRSTVIKKHISTADAINSAIIIQKTLILSGAVRRYQHFCGSHAMSLTRDRFEQIQSHAYVISKKLDGVRYLAVVHERRVWFMGRDFIVWSTRTVPELSGLENMLLDGEMVDDLFYVIDVIAVNGKTIINEELAKRFRVLHNAYDILSRTGITFKPQSYYPLTSSLEMIVNEYEMHDRAYDGLVFTPAKLPYRLGIDRSSFKWKNIDRNTVDFLAKDGKLWIQKIKPYELEAVANIGTVIEEGEIVPHENRIVECSWDYDHRCWHILKIRTDKLKPNFDWVAQRIIQSISDRITIRDLLELLRRLPPPSRQNPAVLQSHRDAVDYVASPPPPENIAACGEYLQTPY